MAEYFRDDEHRDMIGAVDEATAKAKTKAGPAAGMQPVDEESHALDDA